MQLDENGKFILSASDLMRFQGCEHATTLDRNYLMGDPLQPAEDLASAILLQDQGHAHEGAYLSDLRTKGDVAEIETKGVPFKDAETKTLIAMREGHKVVYQAALSWGPWAGYADFLERREGSSQLGDFHYEVVDTKLASRAEPKHLLQLSLYSDIVASVQGRAPAEAHLVLGDKRRESFRLAEMQSYTRHVRDRLQAFVAEPRESSPEPVKVCGFCRWREHCQAAWEAKDSIVLVAGITKSQRVKLRAAGVETIGDLADCRKRVPKLAQDTLERLKQQAKLQQKRRRGGRASYVLKPVEQGRGLARLPEPATGDLFFDMEGDPHVEGGLEYLFGIYFIDDHAQAQFRPYWAHDRSEERRATADVLRFFDDHLRSHPAAHIYHYNHYEVTALKRLASSHGVGEVRLDQLLRRHRFVDLYRVVQQGIVASEPGYSLKDLEAFYMAKRSEEVATAGDSIIAYEEWRASRDPQILENIRAYNETDCRSTMLLRDWLVDEVRPGYMAWYQPPSEEEDAAAEEKTAEDEAERQLLIDAVEAERERLGDDLADLLPELAWFHHREDKPQWWAMFDRAERQSEDLIDDLDSLGGLVAATPAQPDRRSIIRAYRFPPQETKLTNGTQVKLRDGLAPVTLVDLDFDEGTALVKFGPSAGAPPERIDLIPGGPIRNDVLRAAVRRVVGSILTGDARYPGVEALLRRSPPKIGHRDPSDPIVPEGMDPVEGLRAAVIGLDGSCLPVQGPPGTGKTYASSLAILDLIRAGHRVGVSSNSHKAIDNLLAAVAERAREQGQKIEGVKKGNRGDEPFDPDIEIVDRSDDPLLFQRKLVGGTAWFFAREECDRSFDYLFVDEAGQVSLANIAAMGTAARNLILVGDPQQLPQPIQGAHPGETGLSALEYAIDHHATIPPERGVFLPTSRRMHPAICRFISEVVYEGRLDSHPLTADRGLFGDVDGLDGPPIGIRFVDVEHQGNGQSSEEEAEKIRDLYRGLLRLKFVEANGNKRRLGPADILIVAPYNAQVNLLRRRLPDGARVGTIDKFQGQEAPISLVSMATSGADELPRDIAFLFSLNRLNVAVSRAQILSVVVANPGLLDVPCRTISELRLVNALCALREYATGTG